MIEQQILNYKITKIIGKGGMATVYEAIHIKLDTKVAVKILDPILATNETIYKRFVQEAKIMASLNHENITKVIDFDDQDKLAILMEILDGQTLNDYIKQKGALAPTEAKQILTKILNACSYAHKKNIVHRDIKPSNIFITNNGEVKIMDFGIAKIIEDGANVLTQTGTQMGTPVYMSPEQVNDSKRINHLSDIYSLGVCLWFMLSGKPPYDGKTMSMLSIYNKIDKEPLADLPNTEMNAIVQKATAKDKDLRFSNCEEFSVALVDKNANSEETVVEAKINEKPVLTVATEDTKKNVKHNKEKFDERKGDETFFKKIGKLKEYIHKNWKSEFIPLKKKQFDELLWNEAKKKNSIKYFELYLEDSYNKQYEKEAEKWIKGEKERENEKVDKFKWKKIETIAKTLENDDESLYDLYSNHYKQYPNSIFVKKAKKIAANHLWNAVIVTNNKKSYENFIFLFPNHSNTVIAKDKIEQFDWEEFKKGKQQIEKYQSFVKKYPNTKHLSQIHKTVWTGVLAENNKIIFQKFINLFPNHPNIENAKEIYENIYWNELKNHKSNIPEYNKFLEQFSNTKHRKEIDSIISDLKETELKKKRKRKKLIKTASIILAPFIVYGLYNLIQYVRYSSPMHTFSTSSYKGFSSVVFSPDGRSIYASQSNEIIQWDSQTFNEIKKYIGAKININSIDVSPNNKFIVSGSGFLGDNKYPNYELLLWNTINGKTQKFNTQVSGESEVKFSSDGKYILNDITTYHPKKNKPFTRKVILWDTYTKEKIHTLITGNDKSIITPNNELIFAVLYSKTKKHYRYKDRPQKVFSAFNIKTGLPINEIDEISEIYNAIAMSPNSKYLAFGYTYSDEIRILETKNRKNFFDLTKKSESTNVLRFSLDSKYLFAGKGYNDNSGNKNGIGIWDVEKRKRVKFLSTKSAVTSIDITKDRKYLISNSGNELQLWDISYFCK